MIHLVNTASDADSSLGAVARALLEQVRAAGMTITFGEARRPRGQVTRWHHGYAQNLHGPAPDIVGFQTDRLGVRGRLGELVDGIRFLYAPSSWVLQEARDAGYRGWGCVIPHGLDPCFVPMPSHYSGPPTFLLVACGGEGQEGGPAAAEAYLQRKGLPLVAEAWKRAPMRDWRLRVVTHLVEAAVEMLSAGVPRACIDVVAPPRKTENWPAIYQSAHVLLAPSKAEAFGLPPVQALACGLPVIMTRVFVGSAEFIPSKHCMAIDTADNLADAFATVADRWPELRDVALGAGERLRESLAWPKVAVPLIEALKWCEV